MIEKPKIEQKITKSNEEKSSQTKSIKIGNRLPNGTVSVFIYLRLSLTESNQNNNESNQNYYYYFKHV